MRSRQSYVYKEVDGLEIEADVYPPPNGEMRPGIIWLHGGALMFGNRDELHSSQMDQVDRYVAAGYSVVAIDYRLAPETKLPGIIADLADAYAWVVLNGPGLLKIDPDRIALMGHSAGGYLALTGGFRLAPRPKAVVSFYGYGDITQPWYSQPEPQYLQQPLLSEEKALSGVGDVPIARTADDQSLSRCSLYVYCRQQGTWPSVVGGRSPSDEHDWFHSYEPIQNVSRDFPPTLLLHGQKDLDVPVEKSVQMAEALRRHSVACDLISNPDWGHCFDNNEELWKTDAVQTAFGRLLEFLDEHV